MKSKGLNLTTRFNQNRVITLAGAQLFSKRLNGEEEMYLQEMQLEAAVSPSSKVLSDEVDFIADVLRFRAVTPEAAAGITREFVLEHMGKHTSVILLNYLRNGSGLLPSATLDRPVFTDPEDAEDDGTLTLEDRTFRKLALNYAEQLMTATRTEGSGDNVRGLAHDARSMVDTARRMDAAGTVTPEQLTAAAEAGETAEGLTDMDEEARKVIQDSRDILARAHAMTRLSAEACAEILNARLLSGEPISGEWLLQTVTDDDVSMIFSYLTDGQVETPDAEGEEGDAGPDAPNVAGPVSA